MNKTNQGTIVKDCILSYMDKGLNDKQDIYTKVVEELGIPRPTVRRCGAELRKELKYKVEILSQPISTKPNIPKVIITHEGENNE